MGYWLISFFVVAIITVSCFSGKKTVSNNLPLVSISKTDSLAGMEMIASDNCVTCHSINEKLIGPAFKQVSKKYKPDEPTVNKLAQKIITGGSGSWGQIPMVPHPNLSNNSARTIVKFILSLENH